MSLISALAGIVNKATILITANWADPSGSTVSITTGSATVTVVNGPGVISFSEQQISGSGSVDAWRYNLNGGGYTNFTPGVDTLSVSDSDSLILRMTTDGIACVFDLTVTNDDTGGTVDTVRFTKT